MFTQKYYIKRVWLTENYREGLIDIGWYCEIGRGHLSFKNEGEDIICSSEGMSKNFVKAVLTKLVDDAIFEKS